MNGQILVMTVLKQMKRKLMFATAMKKICWVMGLGGQQKRVRTSTKWPNDMIVVSGIDRGGMPTERNQKLRLRMLAGLIARQRLSLVMPGFKSLSDKQKWFLFDKYVQPFLEFPPEMKPFGFRQVMKSTAKAWRTHKSKLKANYIKKGLTPFGKHPYIEPEDWK